MEQIKIEKAKEIIKTPVDLLNFKITKDMVSKGKFSELSDFVTLSKSEYYLLPGTNLEINFDTLLSLEINESMVGKNIAELLSENKTLIHGQASYLSEFNFSGDISVLFKDDEEAKKALPAVKDNVSWSNTEEIIENLNKAQKK